MGWEFVEIVIGWGRRGVWIRGVDWGKKKERIFSHVAGCVIHTLLVVINLVADNIHLLFKIF